MFNGIIYNQGIIKKLISKKGKTIYIFSKILNNKHRIYISCDGVCLTLISIKNKTLEFYLYMSY